MQKKLKIISVLAAVGFGAWLGITVARSETNTYSGTLTVTNWQPDSFQMMEYNDLMISGGENKPWLRMNRKQRPPRTNYWGADTSWSATNMVMATEHKPVVTKSNQVWLITFEDKGK